MKATWNNTILAESPDTVVVEDNHYFPLESVNMEYLRKSGNQYTCPWKGVCDYYTITIDGQDNIDVAWMYPNPKPAAKEIAGRFAFWKGVEITK